ncbi:MAG: hypothetical protein AABZ60_09805 [Planctomycetota bacterium]
MKWIIYATAFACLMMGCSHIDTVSSPTGILISQGDADIQDYASIAHLYAERCGFFLFGAIPLVRADLGWGIDQLVKEAKQKGANGIIELEYEIDAPHFFDWTPEIHIKGNAVTFKK